MAQGKGKLAAREKSADSKRHSNVMGFFEEGYLFNHSGRHTARYQRINGKMACSKCKEPLE